MKVEAKGIAPLPAKIEEYVTNILQLKEFKIIIYNEVKGVAAWVFAVKDLTTGAILYVIQENYIDEEGKEVARFLDYTKPKWKKFRDVILEDLRKLHLMVEMGELKNRY